MTVCRLSRAGGDNRVSALTSEVSGSEDVRTGSGTGPPRGGRAPRVGISSIVISLNGH